MNKSFKSKLIENYNNSINLIKDVKWYTIFILGIFCFFFIFGFIFPIFFQEQITQILRELLLKFEGLNTFQTIYTIFFNNLQASFVVLISGLFFGYMTFFSAIQNAYLLGFVGREVVGLEGLSSLLQLIPHGIFELPAIFISMGLGLYLANSFLEIVLKIKTQKKRFFILTLFSLILLPLIFYQVSITNINNAELSLESLSNSQILFLSSFNMIQLFLIIFVFISSLQNKEMKKRIFQSIKTFILIIVPLLIIAALIEGLLMGLA